MCADPKMALTGVLGGGLKKAAPMIAGGLLGSILSKKSAKDKFKHEPGGYEIEERPRPRYGS